MIFRLILDPAKEEEIVATVHERSALIGEIEALITRHNGTDRVIAYTESDVKVLPFAQIECITVIDGKTYAIDTHGEQFQLKQRLYEIEGMLPSCFFRINKSSIANQNALERFHAAYSGAVDAIFKCGYTDYVSRRCFADIKRRLNVK